MLFVDRKCPKCGNMMRWNSRLVYHCDKCNNTYKLGTKAKLL